MKMDIKTELKTINERRLQGQGLDDETKQMMLDDLETRFKNIKSRGLSDSEALAELKKKLGQ
jgi:hypothetical protein